MSTLLDAMTEKYTKEYKENGKIENVPHPKLFVETLKELRDDFVGNEEIKESMMNHIMSLMMNNEMQDMHTVICGPPGTGKTTLGTIWGKLVYSIGKIDNTPIPDNKGIFENIAPEQIAIFSLVVAGIELMVRAIRGMTEIYNITNGGISKLDEILGTSKQKEESIFKNKIFRVIIIIVVCAIVYCIYRAYKNSKNDENNKNSELDELNANNIVKVVQRKDFVAEYIGQTEPKTDALLRSCNGKVVIIDEAYQLAPDGAGRMHDFGSIACTQLNEHMSKYSTRTVIIFIGYEDELKRTIFANQPGFERRIKFNFQMKPYSPPNLWSIFLTKVKEKGYDINKDEISNAYREIFEGNSSLFTKGQGGDMAKLRDFAINSKTVKSARNYLKNGNTNNNKDKTISYDDIEGAVNEFKKNKLKDTSNKYHRPNYDLFSRMGDIFNQQNSDIISELE